MAFLPEYSKFAEIFAAEQLEITEKQYEQLEIYARMLVEWNEKMNLTGITDPKGIAVKHFLDSILPFKFINVPRGTIEAETASPKKAIKLIDVGTGAGFPGLPMKIYRPDLELTLLDSLNKRINFLSAVCDEAKIKAECVHARAEEGGRSPLFREKFDIAVARAVAAMPVLTEYCLPYVKVGGIFAALKGPNENYKDGENAVKTLGGEISEIKEYTLPNGDKRTLIVVEKVKSTPSKYPRNGGQIAKKAL